MLIESMDLMKKGNKDEVLDVQKSMVTKYEAIESKYDELIVRVPEIRKDLFSDRDRITHQKKSIKAQIDKFHRLTLD